MENTTNGKEQITEKDIADFASSFCPWGYRDIATALQAMQDVGDTGDDLQDLIEEFMTDCDIKKLEDIDPCYIAYDRILQNARNTIDEVIGIDIMNDYGFYTYGNYMCTSFDWGSDDIENLKEELAKADKEDIETIKDCPYAMYFLDSVDISI